MHNTANRVNYFSVLVQRSVVNLSKVYCIDLFSAIKYNLQRMLPPHHFTFIPVLFSFFSLMPEN